MGLNKRYFKKDSLLNELRTDKSLEQIFNADVFFFLDTESNTAHQMFMDGKPKQQILKYIEYENN